jgi:hypothetical protein
MAQEGHLGKAGRRAAFHPIQPIRGATVGGRLWGDTVEEVRFEVIAAARIGD